MEKIKYKYHLLFALLVLSVTSELHAQISGYNIAEFQLGNLPYTEPSDLTTLYDQLQVSYQDNNIRAGIRYETFLGTDSNRLQYQDLSRYYFQYEKNKLEIGAGNFYESFGRGLLLRSYEISGAVLEDQLYRVRYSFFRDMRGFYAKYKGKSLQIKILRGQPLLNLLPPTVNDRRLDIIEGIESSYKFKSQTAGAVFMRSFSGDVNKNYASAYIQGNLPFNLSYYSELAHNVSDSKNLLAFTSESSYGFYGSLNFSYNTLGISAEYKNYQNLFLGSGYSDPPTLVKEHSYRVLNRGTHVIDLSDESGYQLELFYMFKNGAILTLNHARAKNELFQNFIFKEFFAEIHSSLGQNWNIKAFADYSEDPFNLEPSRYATGIYATRYLSSGWNVSLETEYQAVEKEISGKQTVSNIYLGLLFARSTKISAALLWEYTTDPVIADNPDTDQTESSRSYPAISFAYRFNQNNRIQLFAGSRRGGPACTSGICYEVLDFEGIEIRLTTKF
jgi:hypothetical protein